MARPINPPVSSDDWLRITIYENLRHEAYTTFCLSGDPIERRIFEIEYNRYDDLIRMIRETA